jgi:hypothetical protein|tara:strand:+ start:232 stop:687 length:456 start_codon:yes stop_codon:yes gene_type:complete
MQTAGLMYIVSAAGSLMISSTLKPIVNSTISMVSSLTSSSDSHKSLEKVLHEIDLVATIKLIEATVLAMDCSNEPIKTASTHVIDGIKQINGILTKIADITAGHQCGYISRWRTLDLSDEITEIYESMEVLNKRFNLLCNINSMKNKYTLK